MRIGGKFGGVLAVHKMRRRGGKKGGGVNGVRITHWVGGGMKWLGKHSGDSESGKRIGIGRGRENVGKLAGHKGL
jgi:hypothetical protein